MKLMWVTSLLIWVSGLSAQHFHQCGTMELMNQRLQDFPTFQDSLDKMASLTELAMQQEVISSTVQVIPVVVHVVYGNNPQDISTAQIQSQIDALNRDFRRQNADRSNTRPIFVGRAVDTEIEFCLATRDPDGNVTNGITRTFTNVGQFQVNDKVKSSSTGGVDPWPREDYLNIWVCNLGGGVAGFASFPGDPSEKDGVVIHYQFFGTTGNVFPPYNMGRTTVHEVGHWLGLFHPWGDGPSDGCQYDDQMMDTPNSEEAHYGCPSGTPNTCIDASNDLPDMYENYMEYTNDACMNLFTQDQMTKMKLMLKSFRNKLQYSFGCVSVGRNEQKSSTQFSVFPNPTNGIFTIDFGRSIEGTVHVVDITGRTVWNRLVDQQRSIIAPEIPTGLYRVVVRSGDHQQTIPVSVF